MENNSNETNIKNLDDFEILTTDINFTNETLDDFEIVTTEVFFGNKDFQDTDENQETKGFMSWRQCETCYQKGNT